MKNLTIVFWLAVAGVGVSFVFAIATAIQLKKQENAPITLPLPATPHS